MTHMPRVLGGRDVEASGKLLRGGLAALSFSASSAMSVLRAERGLFLSEPRHERRAAGGRRNAACPTRPRRAVSGRTEGSEKVREASAALRVVAVLLVVCSARSGLSFSRDWSGEWRKGYNSLSSFSLWDSQDNFQGWMTEPAGLPVGAEQTLKRASVATQLMKREKEVSVRVPSNELDSTKAVAYHEEQSLSELRKGYVYRSTERPEKTEIIKPLVTDHDAFRNCELYLPMSSNCSAVESSEDSEEDMYRDAEEIERERVSRTSSSDYKLSVAPEMDIMEYCRKEWRGNTPVAKRMRKGYEAVAQKFASIRRVRGDNYCAFRATLFQALSQATQLPSWLQSEDFTMLPENLLSKYDWIRQWQLKQKLSRRMGEISDEIKDYLILLRKKWKNISEIKGPTEKQEACDKLFKNEEEEYSLYEALKFLMLNTAIELYNDDKNGRRVPVFSWLLFARDTSSNPCQLMHNHLNHIGHSGGLEQVEMFLLAYALQYTIQVYRLYKYSTDEFVTLYPNDPEEDWPVVTLITEDDRHYNIPVRMCQETML